MTEAQIENLAVDIACKMPTLDYALVVADDAGNTFAARRIYVDWLKETIARHLKKASVVPVGCHDVADLYEDDSP